MDAERREYLGRVVRTAWLAWAQRQPDPKPSWLLPWEQLTEPEKEVDRLIGETIWRAAEDYQGRLIWHDEGDPPGEQGAWASTASWPPEHWLPWEYRSRPRLTQEAGEE